MISSKREIVETSASETHSVLRKIGNFIENTGIHLWIKELSDYVFQVNKTKLYNIVNMYIVHCTMHKQDVQPLSFDAACTDVSKLHIITGKMDS